MVPIDEMMRQARLVDNIRDQLEPFPEITRQRLLSIQDPISEMRTSLAGHEEAFRDALSFSHGLAGRLEEVSSFAQTFVLPQFEELRVVRAVYEQSSFQAALEQLQISHGALQHAMESMHEPWLDLQNIAQSFSGFAELAGIGQALAGFEPFSPALSDIVRLELGDWEDVDIPSPQALQGGNARTEFYHETGFNPVLTAFPTPAFSESLTVTGIRLPLPPQSGSEADEDLAAELFRLLRRIERHIRHFLQAEMSRLYGPRWIKQRVPGDVVKTMKERRSGDRSATGAAAGLLEYADFGDYIKIILRSDNWQDVFGTHFLSPNEVEVSLTRLNFIRRSTMHSREVTHEDILYAWTEGRRILQALGIW